MKWPVALALLAGAAVILTAGSAVASSPSSGPITPEQRAAYRAQARAVSEEIEQRYGIEGLADYLDAVAYWESRWNAGVGGDGGISIGLYQMQANSAFRANNGLEHLRPRANTILRDPTKATILAADYAVAGIKRARQQGNRGDWLAVRRWWANPSLVHDDSETASAHSPKVRERFTKALRAVGVPTSFMERRPNVSGYPGVEQVLDDLNVNLQGASA